MTRKSATCGGPNYHGTAMARFGNGVSSTKVTGQIVRPSVRLKSKCLADAMPKVGSDSAMSIKRQVSTTQAITDALPHGVQPSSQPCFERRLGSAGRNRAWPSHLLDAGWSAPL